MKREYLAALAVFAVLTGFCGCGRELHPVGGTLVWEDGQPATELEGATIYFESTEHRSVSRGAVQEGAHFQLTTDRPEAYGPDGVPPGVHRVYVIDAESTLMEPRFRRPETSGLEVTVPLTGPVELRVERARVAKSPEETETNPFARVDQALTDISAMINRLWTRMWFRSNKTMIGESSGDASVATPAGLIGGNSE